MTEAVLSDYFYGNESEQFMPVSKFNRLIWLSEATKDVCGRVDDGSHPVRRVGFVLLEAGKPG